MKIRKKFYTFVAGQDVPKWLIGTESKDRQSMMYNKSHAKLKFTQSVVVVRVIGCDTPSVVMRTKPNTPFIRLSKAKNINIGKVDGATGFFMSNPSLFSDLFKISHKELSFE